MHEQGSNLELMGKNIKTIQYQICIQDFVKNHIFQSHK